MSRLRVAAAALVLSVRSVAGSCEEVWFEEGEFGIEREAFTCGERIVYLQSPQGGLLTEQEARVQTALENDECADCWPWEKYRQDGETDRSSKRGIAIESSLLTAESLSTLGKTISWGVTWGYKITGPDLSVWEMAGVDFIPMVWGHGTIPLAEADGLPKGSKALLGFNEPNFPDQANLDPYWAAQHWPDVEKLAAANNISYIVSPALNYHWSFDPIDWLYQFFAICEGCKVDAVALHVFSCYAAGLKYHLDRYRVFGKPLWVTEIACSDPASPERLSAEGQMAYMKEAIPLLEADDDVEMYAWFSYFKDEWAHPIVNGENGDAGIVFPNGTLSPLGELYNSFAAGSNKTEINITMPEWKNETVSTTATSETVATSIATTSTSSATDTATLTLSSVTSTITATFATATGTSTSATSTRTSATLTATETTVTATQTTTTATTTQTTVTATSTETSITSADTGTSTASSTVSSTLTSSATDTVTSSSTLTTTKTTVTVTATSSTATWSGITSTRTATTWTATTQTSTRSTTQTGTATLTAAQTGTSTLSQIITMTTSQTGTSTATATQSSTATTTQTGTSTLTRTLSGTSTVTASQTGTSTLSSTEATTSTSASANGTTTATLTVTKVSALSATSTTESTSTATSSSTAKKESTTPEPQRKYTTRHLTGTAPSTTLTQGESTTSTEPEYDDEDNSTNDTDSEIDFLSCTEAVESWCQADPSAAPFYPLRHCADWRLHDAMCTSSAPIAAQPAFAGLEMPSGNFPAAFLFVAMGASAMTGAVLASLYNKQKCCLPLCCRRKTRAEEEQEALKRAASGKKCEWQGTCMPVMGKHGSAATARVAPDPGVFLPEEAVARRVAFSPQNAKNAPCEGSPMMASLSKASNWNEIAVGTPVGTTPASRAAALTMLADAISKATAEDTSLEEKQSWLDQAGRLLSGGAAMNLPMNVRQEAESWQSRQEDRLRLAKSMEEVVNRAASLQNAAEETSAPDPLKGLLSRVKRDEEGNREAMLAEAARRASAFQEELDSQRLKLKARRKGDKSILDAADLMEQKQELADMQQKVVQEMSKLQEWKGEPAVGDNDCVGACNALEEAWKQFAVNLEGMSEEALAALHAATETKTAKVFSSDAERQAALAEAARRQALFQEELQKQRHKLQKRSKAKTAAPAPVEFGRLLEDQAALQALEVEREAAMEECQRYIGDARAYGNSAEENKWIDVLQGWHGVEEDLPQLSTNELPEGTWSAMASRAKTGKVSVGHDEQLALLAEAARRAAAFDEELQKQRSHMKKRRKALQKGELEQADPLEACRTLADEEVLKRLAKEQADACAQCEAMAAIGDGVAWEELGAAWAQMQKDISKAEKEAREAAKVVAETGCGLVEALGLTEQAVQSTKTNLSAVRRVEDDSEARRAALQEAARRIAAFDEELSKQKAAMRRRRADHPKGPRALGSAVLEGEALQALAAKHAEGLAACKGAADAAAQSEEHQELPWQDLLNAWGDLQADLSEATDDAAAEAKACCAEEACQALAARALAAAAKRAAAFERELGRLAREGCSKTTSSLGAEVRYARQLATVRNLRDEAAEGLATCEASVVETGKQEASPQTAELRDAWQELVSLWQDLGNSLEAFAKELVAPSEPSVLRRSLDASVSDSERQTALAEAARRAAQFDEELQKQRQRLARRHKKIKGVASEVGTEGLEDRLLALGDAFELQVLAADQEAAKSACKEALSKAEEENKWEEVQGWQQVVEAYESLSNDLQDVKKEVQASGGLAGEPDRTAGKRLVQKVARDQKASAEGCLKAVEQALQSDQGPLQEVLEAKQARTRSNGGSSRIRGAEVTAQVQTWDVLTDAQSLLESLQDSKGAGSGEDKAARALQDLEEMGLKAASQLEKVAAAHAPPAAHAQTEPELEKEKAPQEGRAVGCQTVFRLGGMAWHANPAIQRLLEDLVKVSTAGPATDPRHWNNLDREVTGIMSKWRIDFVDKHCARPVQTPESPVKRQLPDVPIPQVGAATRRSISPPSPPPPPAMLEADVVTNAARKKQVECTMPAWGEIKRDEAKVEVETSSFQSSTYDSTQREEAKPARSLTRSPPATARAPRTDGLEVDLAVRRQASAAAAARRASSPGLGMLPATRLARAEQRRQQAASDYEGQSSEPLSVSKRPSRRRESSLHRGEPGSDSNLRPHQHAHSPEPEEPEIEEPTSYVPQSKGQMTHNDLLAQLEEIKSGPRQTSPQRARQASPQRSENRNDFKGRQVSPQRSENHSDFKTPQRPSSAVSRRGGPGDGSLLVPPSEGARSTSPTSTAASSPSPGPRRLDPIVRPRGPPLPSAGRMLLASQQESPAHSPQTSPRTGF